MPPTYHFDLPPGIVLDKPPILIGRAAFYYYGIGDWPDEARVVITEGDFDRLMALYPERVGKKGSDQSLSFETVTFLRTIQLFCYNAIRANCLSLDRYAVISLDRLYSITSLDFANPTRENEMVKILNRMKQKA